jgi:putative salt-induced outer membrane protein YdiY
MKLRHHSMAAVLAALAGLSSLRADVIETKDGARLVGKVTRIEGGTVTLSTKYAGEIAVQQSEVAVLETEGTVAVRLASGTRIDGRISSSGSELKIIGEDGVVSTQVSKIAASWQAGGEDPQVGAMRRKWTFQTAADISGKSGNTTNSTIGMSFVAALTSPQDSLKFYGSYQYATTSSAKNVTPRVTTKSADNAKAGVDYSSFFDATYGWFVRSELEQDRVAGVDLRSTSDFGATMRFIHNSRQSLVGRLGAGYRFEAYSDSGQANSKGAVLSTGLNHIYTFNKYASIVTDLQYIPSVDDFADYRFVHDTALEVPISAGFWKLRVGVNNQYTSRPLRDREALDTTYYTRLILNWK